MHVDSLKAQELLRNAVDIKCKCGCDVFIDGYNIKRIPAVYSMTGKPEVIPIQTMVCQKCSAPLEDILRDADSSEPTNSEPKSTLIGI